MTSGLADGDISIFSAKLTKIFGTHKIFGRILVYFNICDGQKRVH